MRRLLFLNGIKAFEAAARGGSFAAAGAELNVSPAAVSRMVHLLEERLGVELFERKANRLLPTAAGRAYQSGLTPIFDALASLTAQVTAPTALRVLTIGVGPTFAMRWLIPRLADFSRQEPAIEVRFTTGGVAVPFGDDWSCGIKLGDGDWPGLIAEPLFAADLTPVCTPKLAASIRRAGDLKPANLLRVAHSPEDWPAWLKAAGVPRLTARGTEFNITARRCRRRSTGSASPWVSGPISTTISPPAALLPPFLSRCRRACAGIWSIARSRPSSVILPPSGAGSCVPLARLRAPRIAKRIKKTKPCERLHMLPPEFMVSSPQQKGRNHMDCLYQDYRISRSKPDAICGTPASAAPTTARW